MQIAFLDQSRQGLSANLRSKESGYAVITDAITPLGSLLYPEDLSDRISTTGETDSFTLDLDAGQTLTAVVDPAAGLQAAITVLGAGGIPVGVGTGTFSDDVVVQTVPIGVAGSSTVAVSGTAGTTGNYALQLLLNAATEDESHDGPLNDTFATAQDIDSSFLGLGLGRAERGAVRGSLPAPSSISVASGGFESGGLGDKSTTFSAGPAGRIQVTASFGVAGGSFALLMDTEVNTTATLNEAIWTVDLSGAVNATLQFSHADCNDEETLLPTDFVGSINGDGVAISDDGLNWRTVTNATDVVVGTWESVAIDLTAEAAAAGMTLGANFQIKFQQWDNL